MSLLLARFGNIFPGITGTASITEANDTLSSTAALAITGTASTTEANDTLSSTAALAIKGAASITEANDTLSATAALAIKGAESTTEADDTLSSAGVLAIKGQAAITEANDSLSSTGTLAINGTASIIEANDALTATGTLAIKGSEGATEADDVLTATGLVHETTIDHRAFASSGGRGWVEPDSWRDRAGPSHHGFVYPGRAGQSELPLDVPAPVQALVAPQAYQLPPEAAAQLAQLIANDSDEDDALTLILSLAA